MNKLDASSSAVPRRKHGGAEREIDEGEIVKKRSDQSEEARQWAMTFYLIIAAVTLAGLLALALAERYL